ncbi:MAG TPA: hypothetical protein PKX31_00185 [Chitinophagaceae bacterium]|nr:hypothetical protein [Chitinophagaceae bacterium]
MTNKSIKMICHNDVENTLPNFLAHSTSSLITQTTNYLKDYYNLVYQWLDIRHVSTTIIDGELAIFYSSFVPLGFINENTIKYINQTSDLPFEIVQEIQSSLRLYPY